MEMVWPIGAESGSRNKVFHAIEEDKNPVSGETHFIHYNDDRGDFAECFLPILPAFVAWMYGEEIARDWFYPTVYHTFGTIQFMVQNNQWTGNWRTEEDVALDQLVAEEAPIDVDNVAGLPAEQEQESQEVVVERHVHAATDDASAATTFTMAPRNQQGAATRGSNGAGAPRGSGDAV